MIPLQTVKARRRLRNNLTTAANEKQPEEPPMNLSHLALAFTASVLVSAVSLAQRAPAPQDPPPNPCDRIHCPAGTQCVAHGVTAQCVPQIPTFGQPQTNLSQALTQINNNVYEFAVDTSNGPRAGHVMMNFFPVGGSGAGWFDLGAPPSNSDGPGAITGPSATSVPGSGFIFLIVANKDQTICLNQGHDTPQTWTGWRC